MRQTVSIIKTNMVLVKDFRKMGSVFKLIPVLARIIIYFRDKARYFIFSSLKVLKYLVEICGIFKIPPIKFIR